jgi:hypothetical protein
MDQNPGVQEMVESAMSIHCWRMGPWPGRMSDGLINIEKAALIFTGLEAKSLHCRVEAPRCFSGVALQYAMAFGFHIGPVKVPGFNQHVSRRFGVEDSLFQ